MSVSHVGPGISRIRLPLPPPLREVNAYLIEGSGSWTLVDCGLHTENGEGALRAGLAAAGVRDHDLRHVFVTHLHPDHLGMAGMLERAGAEVIMNRGEAEAARRIWWGNLEAIDETAAWFVRHGLPPNVIDGMRESWIETRGHVDRVERIRTVEDGEHLTLDGRELTVVWTPGHTDHHATLLDPSSRLLFSGDHVLPRISPNIGLYTSSPGDPLGDFLDSLRRVARLPVSRVLPAHGEPFDDLPGRVAELLDHHARRLEVVLEAVGSGEFDAYQVSRRVFPAARSATEQRFALAETLAHLRHLRQRGQLFELDGAPRRWRAAAPGP